MIKSNRRGHFIGIVFCMACLLVAANSFIAPSFEHKDPPLLSPTDFAIDIQNSQLIIAQKTGYRIDFVDIVSGAIYKSISTDLPPTGICLDNKGKAYVTCSHSIGNVLVIDLDTQSVIEIINTGHGAISPRFSSHTNRLYIANQYNDDISVIDIALKKEISRIDVLRQPMAMDITPDGRWLYVANLLPSTRADIDTVAAEVSIIDLGTEKVMKHVKLSNGSNALRGIKTSPDGNYVFVSHNLGRFQVPTSQLEQGWMNTSALSVLNTTSQSVLATILLDEPENGAAGSWGVDVNEHVIAVSHASTHDYSIIDYQAMISKLDQIENADVLSYDLTFLNDIRTRYPVLGEGPRAIRLFEDKLISTLYFSDAVQINEISSGVNIAIHYLNPGMKVDSVRMGEMIFNDARHCFQQWQACTGCHPNDARTDGLNWDLMNDGIGNPKNCKSMLLAHETPPSMITGIRPTAEIAVRAGFRHIQFAYIEEEKARAVDLYLQSLKPVPSPFLINGDLSENALKGKKIFEYLECDYCHSGPYFTDREKHEIGIQGISDRSNNWDTPTLIEVWRTAPYLHDGRSASMEDVFIIEKHGITRELKKVELDDLVKYVLSL